MVGILCLFTILLGPSNLSASGLLGSAPIEESFMETGQPEQQKAAAPASNKLKDLESNSQFDATKMQGRPWRVSDLLCSPMRPNPHKIAICIAGNTRTFRYPLVYKSIKHHVVDAIGGDATVFAALKLGDAPLDFSHHLWPQPMTNSMEAIEPALKYINVAKTKILPTTNETFPISKRCSFRPGTWLSREGPLKRMIGQYTTLKECFNLILDHERENSMKFDMPWCVYNRNVVYAPVTTDHFNLMDRRLAGIIFDLIGWYNDECNEERTEHDPEDLVKALALNSLLKSARVRPVNFDK
ncbi:hypothetical protein HK101_001005 [Irineochytrium annulatum]|nr:hypothetical protein HK101_001005 [Irineochytrium annulatum]